MSSQVLYAVVNMELTMLEVGFNSEHDVVLRSAAGDRGTPWASLCHQMRRSLRRRT